MSKNVGSYTSAVSFTNTAKQCENKIPELGKPWNITTVATVSFLYTILPIREGFSVTPAHDLLIYYMPVLAISFFLF